MAHPLSIYVTVYNSAPWLERTLQALAAFDEKQTELVFVDDASTDESPAMLERFQASRANVKLLRHETNRGPGAAANTAMAAASGTFIQRCDADDEILADGVLAALDMAQSHAAKLVFSPLIERAPDGRETPRAPSRDSAAPPLERFWRFDGTLAAGLCATLIRARHIRERGLRFCEARPLSGEDTLFMAALLAGVKADEVAYNDRPAYRYIRHVGSFGRPDAGDKTGAEKLALQRLNNFHELEQLSGDFVKQGFLTVPQRDAGLRVRSAEALWALRKAGKHADVIGEYRRIARLYGGSSKARALYWRSLLSRILTGV